MLPTHDANVCFAVNLRVIGARASTPQLVSFFVRIFGLFVVTMMVLMFRAFGSLQISSLETP